MNIYLIGFRCTGKTTVGKIIADRLKMKFIDADDELVKQQGIPISEIVEKHGWAYFREKESDVLRQISEKSDQVVATGGGVILDKDNVAIMKRSGTVIWLKARPETVKQRIVKDQKTADSRPSLTEKGLLEEIEETIKARDPHYMEAMDFCVDTDDVTIEEVVEEIMKKMEA